MTNVSGYYRFNLKLAYLNISSITNKIDEVKEMLGMGMFDILFIAESKIDSIRPLQHYSPNLALGSYAETERKAAEDSWCISELIFLCTEELSLNLRKWNR